MTILDVDYSITAAAPSPTGPGVSGYGVGVDPPPLVPPPVNLVRSSRNPTDPANTRWTNGFRYLPLGNGELDIFDDCHASPGVQIPVTKIVPMPQWQPYVLNAKITCSAMGTDLNELSARAKGLLDAATPKLVEFEFWHGALAQSAGWTNLYLAQAAGVDVYTAASPNDAIGTLEWYLGTIGYGGRGMIHCSAYMAPFLQFVTRREGNLLLTNRDTIVVPGGGYGMYPATSAPTEADPEPQAAPPKPTGPYQLFATGITDVRLGDIQTWPEDLNQSINRATNTVQIRAQRYAVASWDGVAFGRVDLTFTP